MKKITRWAKENRKKKTLPELKLFKKLLKWKIKFRTQRMIDYFIVDFLIPNRRLIIEIDGLYHLKTKEYDNKRQLYLEKKGFAVIRYWNEDVLNTDCNFIKNKILEYPIIKITNFRETYGNAKY